MEWSTTDKQEPAKWESRINEVASNHTQVTGVLAGFSITVVVLIASMKLSNQTIDQKLFSQAAFGLFIAAFFGFVSTGIMYSVSIEREKEHQYYLFSIASLLYYLSVVLSFAAIVLLTKMLDYSEIRIGALCAMFSAVVGGYLAAVVPAHDLLRVRPLYLLIFFALSLILGPLILMGAQIWPGSISVQKLFKFSLPAAILIVGIAFGFSTLTFFDKNFVSKQKFISYFFISLFAITALVGFYSVLVLKL